MQKVKHIFVVIVTPCHHGLPVLFSTPIGSNFSGLCPPHLTAECLYGFHSCCGSSPPSFTLSSSLLKVTLPRSNEAESRKTQTKTKAKARPYCQLYTDIVASLSIRSATAIDLRLFSSSLAPSLNHSGQTIHTAPGLRHQQQQKY